MNKERFEYIIARYLNGSATPEEEKALLLCIRSSETSYAAFKEITARYRGEKDAETDRKWNRIASVIGSPKQPTELKIPEKSNVSTDLKESDVSSELKEANVSSELEGSDGRTELEESNASTELKESDVSAASGKANAVNPLKKSNAFGASEEGVRRVFLSSFYGRRSWLWKIAAVFLVCVGGLSFFFLKHTATDGAARASEWLTIAAAEEDRRCVLPDGTSVYLRRGSSLRYPDDMASFAREVSVRGEAFFEVTPDAARPFVVDASGVWVKVLGTAFSVRTAEETETISVTLVRGSVSLNDACRKELVRLVPDQRADYSVSSGRCTVSEVDGERLTSWRKGIITYDNASLDEIVRLIEQTYGVSLRYDPPAHASQRFSGAFLQTQQLDTVLELTGRLTGTKLIPVK